MRTQSFIAMNRFKVARGLEDAFEALWRSRETHLHEVRGFVSFRLLRSPAGEEYTLFASHTQVLSGRRWHRHAPSCLQVAKSGFEVTRLRETIREEIAVICDVRQVIEFYSR